MQRSALYGHSPQRDYRSEVFYDRAFESDFIKPENFMGLNYVSSRLIHPFWGTFISLNKSVLVQKCVAKDHMQIWNEKSFGIYWEDGHCRHKFLEVIPLQETIRALQLPLVPRCVFRLFP